MPGTRIPGPLTNQLAPAGRVVKETFETEGVRVLEQPLVMVLAVDVQQNETVDRDVVALPG